MGDSDVPTWGDGDRAVLVHGAVSAGEETWQAQQPLADTFQLVVPDRQGYGPGPEMPDDPHADAPNVAALLGDGAHLVGYSMGGVVAMLAAAQRPEAVRSLVLVEPVAFDLVRGRSDAERFIAEYDGIRGGTQDPEAFLREFLVFFGAAAAEVEQIPTPMPPALHRAAVAQFSGAAPWDVATPLEALAGATFPIVIVSGGHSDLFDAICDVLQLAVGATRSVIPGAGHAAQFTGEPFNALLRQTWLATTPLAAEQTRVDGAR